MTAYETNFSIPVWHHYVPFYQPSEIRNDNDSISTIRLINMSYRRFPIKNRMEPNNSEFVFEGSKSNEDSKSLDLQKIMIKRLASQMNSINSIKKEYEYDPDASIKSGLPKYCKYLRGGV